MQTSHLQDHLLTSLRRTHSHVTLFLMNGFQIRGQITGHDADLVIVLSEGRQNAIYKHAISTIMPERPVDLGEG